MPRTEEQKERRRILDKANRDRRSALIQEHPILLERIATLERHILLLKIENEKLKNANKDKKKTERILLDAEIEEIDHEVQEEILNIPINKKPIVLDEEEDEDDFTI